MIASLGSLTASLACALFQKETIVSTRNNSLSTNCLICCSDAFCFVRKCFAELISFWEILKNIVGDLTRPRPRPGEFRHFIFLERYQAANLSEAYTERIRCHPRAAPSPKETFSMDVQHSTYTTEQYSTAQYNTVQYSTNIYTYIIYIYIQYIP